MFNFSIDLINPIKSEILICFMACSILVYDLFAGKDKKHLTYYLTLLAILITLIILSFSIPVENNYHLNQMIVSDKLSFFLKIFLCGVLFFSLVYSKDYLNLKKIDKVEFFILCLFSLLGMMIMVSANHFLLIYLGLELLSLSLYALVAFHRESISNSEAALKFFILGALSSGILLYGISMIYGSTGTLFLNEVFKVLSSGNSSGNLLLIGLVFIVAGIAFKVGAVPFHMWVPDVYEGSTTPVTLLIGAAPKIAVFGFIYRIMVDGLGFGRVFVEWQQMFLILIICSLFLGNIFAIAQRNIKRMLAYSTISHMGFFLIGFIAKDNGGITASLFYIIIYSIMFLGAFGVIMFLANKQKEISNISDLSGLSRADPILGFSFLVILFSMSGIPPTAGFWSKLFVLQSAMTVGYYWLIIFAVIMSLVGAFYYLRIVKIMFFEEFNTNFSIQSTSTRYVKFVIFFNGLILIVLGLFPNYLVNICNKILQ